MRIIQMAKNMSESFNPSYMSIIFGDMYDMNDITRNDIEKNIGFL